MIFSANDIAVDNSKLSKHLEHDCKERGIDPTNLVQGSDFSDIEKAHKSRSGPPGGRAF